jgi:hypothetical protein
MEEQERQSDTAGTAFYELHEDKLIDIAGIFAKLEDANRAVLCLSAGVYEGVGHQRDGE